MNLPHLGLVILLTNFVPLLSDVVTDSVTSLYNTIDQNFTENAATNLSLAEICQQSTQSGRIVGGQPASIQEAPYQVALRRITFSSSSPWNAPIICGGSLIGPKLVLTAGHCFGDRLRTVHPERYRITAGNTFRTVETRDAQVRRVAEVIVHPEHRHLPVLRADIALVVLDAGIEESDFVKTVPLPTRSVSENVKCLVTGWGREDFYNATKPPCLMKATVPVLNLNECRRRSVIPIGKGFICAGFFQGGIDACTGDSGGPLVCEGILYGIVSFGRGCAEKDHPGLYTDVYQHLEWIRTNKAPSLSKTVSSWVILQTSLIGFIIQNVRSTMK